MGGTDQCKQLNGKTGQ